MAATSDRVLRLATGIRTRATLRPGPGGRPLLLLHGWLESRKSFALLVPHLPEDLPWVALDLRGHGDADRPTAGYDVGTLAADVVAALDELDVPEVVLLGSSSGGYVAQQVAVDAAARVSGLVLAGSPADLRVEPPFAAELVRLRDPIDPAWTRDFLLGMAHADRLPPWFVEQAVADALRLPADLWRATVAGLRGSPPPTGAGTVRAPTLVVSGGDDGVLGREQTEALLDAVPGARWVEYPGAGHVLLWDEPARLARDVAGFRRDLG